MRKNVEIVSKPSGGHLCLLHLCMLQSKTAMHDDTCYHRGNQVSCQAALPESHAMPSVHDSLTPHCPCIFAQALQALSCARLHNAVMAANLTL